MERIQIEKANEKKKRGGPRPGSGRPKGVPNRRTYRSLEELKTQFKQLPLDYMLTVLNDPSASKVRRDKMAGLAAPYVHSRLCTTEVAAKDGGAMRYGLDLRRLSAEELAFLERMMMKSTHPTGNELKIIDNAAKEAEETTATDADTEDTTDK